jgi:hypothetical protein
MRQLKIKDRFILKKKPRTSAWINKHADKRIAHRFCDWRNCLIVCSRTSKFSAIWPLVTITGQRTYDYHLWLLAVMVHSFTCVCHTCCDTRLPFLRSERLVILASNCCTLSEGANTTNRVKNMAGVMERSGSRRILTRESFFYVEMGPFG